MNTRLPCLFVLLLFASRSMAQESAAQTSYSFDMENISPSTKMPSGWSGQFNEAQKKGYPVKLDSVVKQNGRYSLSIEKGTGDGQFGVINMRIEPVFSGKRVRLTGYIKTEDIAEGVAGLWMRVDGSSGVLAFDNMQSRGIKGTTDWQQYSIDLDYNEEEVIDIYIGGLMTGSGKMWIDNLELLVDGKPMAKAPIRKIVQSKASLDTAFSNGSGIANITANKETITRLTNLGMLWGFLKYHHPSIAKGDYNWDVELFRVLPKLLAAPNATAANDLLEKWVDALPKPDSCKTCQEIKKDSTVKLMPDYGTIFNKDNLSKSLRDKLTYIKNNRSQGRQYYLGMVEGVGNPEFRHENHYNRMSYPDAGYRLLALYRYWNMIQYFFPDKHLIGENWNNVLPEFIPVFANAADTTAYHLACLQLIARVHDTHANIWGSDPVLDKYFGKYFPPVQTKFIEDKLVVTGYYTDSAGIKDKLQKGDIIAKVDGTPVELLVKKFLAITPASNYETQLRDMPRKILRGNTNKVSLSIEHNGQIISVEMDRYEASRLKMQIDYNPNPADSSYKLLNGNIGYIFPGKYLNRQLPAIRQLFKDTKAIIVDMRCYPSEFMPFTFGSYIKPALSPFAKFGLASLDAPGMINVGTPVSNGGDSISYYKGKIIVIVDAYTQSQAEYTTMSFQSGPNTIVIGSTTAGADGNVSSIYLPGNIFTYMSGLGVLYPDGREAQRAGVRIDIPIRPTIQGIKQGRDEMLEKAMELAEKRQQKGF